jgi:diacylglycerol kinase
MSKDMAAGCVLIASVLSIVVGSILFLNKLIPIIIARF